MNKTPYFRMSFTKRGFTLVEILAVLVIAGIIISGTAVTYNRVWHNNQTDIAENDLRDISNAFSSYLIDYGNITISDDINYETVIEEIAEVLNKQYLTHEIKIDEISSDKKSVKLSTKTKTDPWNSQYQIDIYTYDGADRESIAGLIIVSSRGVDGKSNKANYKNGNYGDDIVAVLEPK